MKCYDFEKGGTVVGWPALVVLFLRDIFVFEHQLTHNITNTTSDHHDDVRRFDFPNTLGETRTIGYQ